ncbi:MAG: Fe2+-dependent dioxygenase [Pseudoxanthomonas sp.]|jgi:PKHD-type hydroxylase|nr:Fe2+-dependent dioxygenase [Pseudoxanthomonas sp.]MDZ3799474.1 Fe2+-dependent dioxygenase [Xanthomonadales bacterium]MBP7464760.1 Fe2+-dependent dioxygenase [Pseudoxanthomonas sp.]MBP8741123.1 Fe2+-dependent dioxygenase [Pseudoxanthomonas sp.]MBP8803673.1 Fe2+-dependent dioxygenase [Pseudoxanthomonas sp.]
MILTLPELVTPDELALIKQKIATVPFIEGKATAGELLKSVKNNQQIPWNHPVMKEITDLVMRALGRCDAFMSLAQPRRLAAMLVSRYEPGMAYGAHVDAPIMGEPNHVRSDVSFTLFLNEPDTYQGGELAFENGSGETAFKLPARSAICYPTGQLHRVRPVEHGERLAVVGWVQSLVREPAIRELLHDLSEARELLVGQEGAGRAVELLTKSYSNLLRRNAEP